jgi:hypothetical protein
MIKIIGLIKVLRLTPNKCVTIITMDSENIQVEYMYRSHISKKRLGFMRRLMHREDISLNYTCIYIYIYMPLTGF